MVERRCVCILHDIHVLRLVQLRGLTRHRPTSTIVASVGSVFMSLGTIPFTIRVQLHPTGTNHHPFGLFAIAKALFATAFASRVVRRRKHIHHTQLLLLYQHIDSTTAITFYYKKSLQSCQCYETLLFNYLCPRHTSTFM